MLFEVGPQEVFLLVADAPATEVSLDGPLGASIRRGLALIEHTPDSLPAYAGSNLRCTSCHLDRGMRQLLDVAARSPRSFHR